MKVKDNKGSITIFVLVGLLFMSSFLLISFASNVNKSKTSKEQFNIISSIYSHNDGDENAYNRAYTAIRKKNAQTLTDSVENSSTIELTKTFDETVSNYTIYGNSVQNATPSIENPVEIENVGEIVNLFYCDDWKVGKTLYGGGAGYGVSNSNDAASASCMYLDLEPNTHYTLSINIDTYYIYRITEMNSEDLCTHNHAFYSWSGAKSCDVYTFITKPTTDYMMIAIRKTDGTTMTEEELSNIKLQVQKGTKVTEYVPHGKYGIPINSTTNGMVNMFNKNDLRVAHALQNYYVETNLSSMSCFGIDIEPSTQYTFSINLDKYYVYRMVEVNSNNISTGIHYFHYESTRYKKHTWTTQSSTDNIAVEIRRIDGANITKQDIIDVQLQIEKGDTATKYTEYQGQEAMLYLDAPLRKVGDVADYIDFSTNKVVRRIGVIDSYNGETITTEYISTTGELTTGATVYYQLETEQYEKIDAQELKTFEDHTKIEVLTEVPPSKIEVEYDGYNLE